MSKIDSSEYEAIAIAYHAGESQSSIGKRYGVSHASIGNILRELNHPTRVGCSRVYREEVSVNHDFIVEAYLWGLSYEQIAENLQVTSATVIYVLKQRGLWKPTLKKLTVENRKERAKKIVMAYKFGVDVPAIKKKYSCSGASVYSALQSCGVELKKRGGFAAKRGKVNADQFKGLYLLGFCCREIAEELGFSTKNVLNLLQKHYPEVLRSPAATKKKQKFRQVKIVNDILTETDQYSHLVSNTILRKNQ